jgi:protein SCO1/2
VHARLRLALTALTVCAAAAVVGVALAARSDTAPPLQLTHGWAGAVRPPGLRVPAFALRDERGRTVTSASLLGKPTVFAFIYSTCRDTCPAQVQDIRGALDEMRADARVHVVGVSVDPANDTRKRAQAFLLAQSMTGRMRFLLGTRAQLAPVWKAFGIQPQTKALEHSAHVVVADAAGMQRIGFPFEALSAEALGHDLTRLVAR